MWSRRFKQISSLNLKAKAINCSNDSKLGLGLMWRRWMSGEQGRRFAALWGNGDYGRLGLESLDSRWRPAVCSVPAFHHQSLKAIACGGAHTLFLTEAGRVYATGLNDFGQLGISDTKNYTMVPLKVSGLTKAIVQISAGYHHSCAVTCNVRMGSSMYGGRTRVGSLELEERQQT